MEAGDVIGDKYRLVELAGEGAMGVVWRAEHVSLGRVVAVKLIRAEVLDEPTIVERFMREAKIAGSIQHPNVVEVFDVGTAPDGAPFMVMPYLEGRDLETLREHVGMFSMERIVELLEGPAGALDMMHERKLVHRDIKPENMHLSISDDGIEVIRLLDFGITKNLQGGTLTQPGQLVGTPYYLPPEIMTQTNAWTTRGDVYSFGVVCFELFVGQPPITGETLAQIMLKKVQDDAPKVSDLTDKPVSPLVEALFMSVLSRDPSKRPVSCGAFIRALRTMQGNAHRSGNPFEDRDDDPTIAD